MCILVNTHVLCPQSYTCQYAHPQNKLCPIAEFDSLVPQFLFQGRGYLSLQNYKKDLLTILSTTFIVTTICYEVNCIRDLTNCWKEACIDTLFIQLLIGEEIFTELMRQVYEAQLM